MSDSAPNYSSAPTSNAMTNDTTALCTALRHVVAELAIIEAIEKFERCTGLKVDGIDYDRPGIFGSVSSPVLVKIRAMVP